MGSSKVESFFDKEIVYRSGNHFTCVAANKVASSKKSKVSLSSVNVNTKKSTTNPAVLSVRSKISRN